MLLIVNFQLLSQEILYDDISEFNPIFFNNNLSSKKMLDKLNRKTLKQSVESLNLVNLKKIKGDSIKHRLFNQTKVYYNVRFKSMKYKTITQSDLNLNYSLKSDNPIYYNGILIPYKNIAICIDAIYEVQIIDKDKYDHLANDVINIWTLKPKKRTGYIK